MWYPFKKKKTPRVGKLSNVAYARWLRACSPQPIIEFLIYDEDEQETLAQAGDDFAEDRAETAAGAIAVVISAVADGLADGGGPAIDEGGFAEQAARSVLPNAPGEPRPRAVPNMGGVFQRRRERIQADQEDVDAPRRLCGLPPDSQRPGYVPPTERKVLPDKIVLPELAEDGGEQTA